MNQTTEDRTGAGKAVYLQCLTSNLLIFPASRCFALSITRVEWRLIVSSHLYYLLNNRFFTFNKVNSFAPQIDYDDGNIDHGDIIT